MIPTKSCIAIRLVAMLLVPCLWLNSFVFRGPAPKAGSGQAFSPFDEFNQQAMAARAVFDVRSPVREGFSLRSGIMPALIGIERPRITSLIQTPEPVVYPGRSLILEDLGDPSPSAEKSPEIFAVLFKLASAGRIFRGLTTENLRELESYHKRFPRVALMRRGGAVRYRAVPPSGPFVFRAARVGNERLKVFEILLEKDVLTLWDMVVDWTEGQVFVGEEQAGQHKANFEGAMAGLRKALFLTPGEHHTSGWHPLQLEARLEGHDRLAEHHADADGALTFILDGKLKDPVLLLSAFLSESIHKAWPGASELAVEARAFEHLFEAVSAESIVKAFAPLEKWSEVAGELAALAAKNPSPSERSPALSAMLARYWPKLPHQTMLDYHPLRGLGERYRRLSPLADGRPLHPPPLSLDSAA